MFVNKKSVVVLIGVVILLPAAAGSNLQILLEHHSNSTTSVKEVRLFEKEPSEEVNPANVDTSIQLYQNETLQYQTGTNISFTKWIPPRGEYHEYNQTSTYHWLPLTNLTHIVVTRDQTTVTNLTAADITRRLCSQSSDDCRAFCDATTTDCGCENPPCHSENNTGENSTPINGENPGSDTQSNRSTSFLYYLPAVLLILLVIISYMTRDEAS